jgi:hypothetical protein
MVEKQVYIEGATVHQKGHLTSDKSESATELKQQVSKMHEEPLLQLSLGERLGQRQEIKVVGIPAGSPRPYPSRAGAGFDGSW